MKKSVFVVNALILTLTSVFLRTVGISFRVYISNKIGAEGMGLYQLIFSVYILAATFATSGISTAVMRLVSEEEGKGKNINHILRKAFALGLTVSVISGVLVFTFAEPISTYWLRDARTFLSLRVLAFSLPFMAASSCLSGYFFAKRKAVISASRQVIEDFVQIAVVVYILNLFLPKGLAYACLALVLGSVIAEILACLYAYILYRFHKRRENPRKNQKGMLKSILAITLPVAATSYLRSIFATAESTLIPLGLTKFGASRENALADFGLVTGMVMPVLFFPSAFLSAFTGLLIPEIAGAAALNHKKRVTYTISRVFQITLLLSILVTGVFLFFSKELSAAIYKGNTQVGLLMGILALLIPLMYLDNVVDGMLKGLNQQVATLKINLFDSGIRLTLIWFMLPMMGLWGYILVLFVSNILNPLLSTWRLVSVVELRINLSDWIVKPILLVISSGMVVKIGFRLLGMPVNVTVAIILAVLIYLLFLRVFDCVTDEDIQWGKSIFIRSKVNQGALESVNNAQ